MQRENMPVDRDSRLEQTCRITSIASSNAFSKSCGLAAAATAAGATAAGVDIVNIQKCKCLEKEVRRKQFRF